MPTASPSFLTAPDIPPAWGIAAGRLTNGRAGHSVIGQPQPVGPQDPTGCRFIHGDVKAGGWRYCQAPTKDDSPWCIEHWRVVFRRISRREAVEQGQALKIGRSRHG